MIIKQLSFILFTCSATIGFSQESSKVVGVVLNENNQPIENVLVSISNEKTYTNNNGFYELTSVASGQQTINFSHLEYSTFKLEEYLKPNQVNEINLILSVGATELETLIIDDTKSRYIGVTKISPSVIRKIPGANAGVENIIKSLPGVNSNNELSTQYSVRGGSYDENLVYVNEIEVYRPFLVRSGQQEGLSFTNTSMVQNVDFSSGGFQSKFGDKMASVLDVTYRRPTNFGFEVDASLLGGGLTVDWASKDNKWSVINGVRYRNNALLVNSQDVSSEYKPQFIDYQALLSFQPNAKFDVSFLGNFTKNIYDFQPQSRVTNFGTITDPKQLLIQYQGKELDTYQSLFGAIKASYKPSEEAYYRMILSAYHTFEEENYDILGSYSMGDVSADLGGNPGSVEFTEGLGTQLNHGRNKYDALILSAEVKGTHRLEKSSDSKKSKEIEWGVRYVSEDVRDRLLEWEVIDSAGFHIAQPIFNTPNNQPYQPYQGSLVPFQSVRATNFVKMNRLQSYAQYSQRSEWANTDVYFNFGVRMHVWNVEADNANGKTQTTISPRAQFAFKPNWNSDMLFRISAGLYHQPPSYRELRRMDGTINADLKAQQSIHFVLSNDYSFILKKIPMKLTTEIYYKDITDVNTYTLENVRIRYRADNEAQAYVYGLDMRWNGEIVPGTESWFSFGYMRTEENYKGKGYIARPTDQRLKFGLLFQDYMPKIPNLKLYLNIVYNTGLPGGSPAYADPYNYVMRLPDYKRADAGFIYVFKDHTIGEDKKWLKNWQELTLGFEIFNLFQNANSITNTWVRDVYSKNMYGIPNYMTMRTFNVKINARW